LVVVGDQSTGKSSVLQAVTEIPFSVNDNMCTRFATEIVLLRTSPNEPTSVDIRIIPDPEEMAERKKILESWGKNLSGQAIVLDKKTVQNIFQQVFSHLLQP
jgi:RNase adaptor protein for sRNA GlmZ degradation